MTYKYFTKSFHVAMSLFSWCHMMAKYGKNKKSGPQGAAEGVTGAHITCWHLLWFPTEQTHGNIEFTLFVFVL